MVPDQPVRTRALAAGVLLALGSAFAGGVARAQAGSTMHTGMMSYVCTTASGHTITGDRPPPECKNRDVRVLNPDGSLKAVIPAPLTPEQRRARNAEEEKQRREEEQERAQIHSDRSLLETYGSAEEIDAARVRAMATPLLQIQRADQKTLQLTRERKRLDDEAEFYAKRELPQALKDGFESNTALLKQQEKVRSDAEHDKQVINERFDGYKKRYLELQEMAAKAAEARERSERELETLRSQEQ